MPAALRGQDGFAVRYLPFPTGHPEASAAAASLLQFDIR